MTVPRHLLGVLAGRRRGGESLEQQKPIKNYHLHATSQAGFSTQPKFLAKGRPAQYAFNPQNVRVTPMPGQKSLRCVFRVSNRPKVAIPIARVMLFRPFFFSNIYIYHQLGLLLSTTYLARKARFITFLRILLFYRQL